MTPHEILGVPPDATQEQIAAAYRKLSATYHPDKPTGDAERFRAIKDAYDILRGKGPKSDEELEADRHFKAILSSMLFDYDISRDMRVQALEDIETARGLASARVATATQKLRRVQRVADRVKHPAMTEVVGTAIAGLNDDIARETFRVRVLMIVRSRVMALSDLGTNTNSLGYWAELD